MRRRHLAPAAAALAAAALLAGCSGGGGDAPAEADTSLPDAAAASVATGAGAQESAALAIAAMGAPAAVDDGAAARTLAAHDEMGAPHDLFAPQVDEGAAEAPAAEAPAQAAAPAPELPVLVPPAGQQIATPGGTTTGPATTTPAAPQAPVQAPLALEADFDVSGEPVVAREGDAIPPDTQQFVVQAITADSVTLKLSGGLLPDGTDSVTLKEGEKITLDNTTTRRSYTIKLVDVRAA